MDEVIDYLTNIPAWFFATCGSALLPIKMSMFSWKRTLNSKHRVGIMDSLGS